MTEDASLGWDAVADEFAAIRSRLDTGLAVVEGWADRLTPGGAVLDAGAGSGEPLARMLLRRGFDVFALDASPRMAAMLRERLPADRVACEPVQTSGFFDRRFDGVLASGLVFLLDPPDQRAVIARLAEAVKPGGRLLFTAPWQACAWEDRLTGRRSVSLGADEYSRTIADAGLGLAAQHVDEGANHYFEAQRDEAGRRSAI